MNCLLCGTDDLQLVTKELRNGPGEVYRCSECDLEMLSGAEVDYVKDYRETHGPILGKRSTPAELYDQYSPFQDRRLALLADHVGLESRVLEVGCSAGYFLEALKRHVREVVGIEPDPEVGAWAREKTGCSVFKKLTELPMGRFDAICLFQVVEHMTDPLGELKVILESLKPEGTLCIEVPSLWDPMLTVYDNEAYRKFFYHEAHRFYFSPKSLQALVEQLGLAGVIIGAQDYTFLNHLHWQFTNKPQPTAKDGMQAHWPSGFLTLTELAAQIDRRYKEFLIHQGFTENVVFVGQRKEK